MFPPTLQQNIRELDRQISLLETECENMEADGRDNPGKTNSKTHTREAPNKLFIPYSCPSTAVQSSKVLNLPPPTSKTHRSTSALAKATNSKCLGDLQKRSEKRDSSDDGDGTQEGCGENSPRKRPPHEVKHDEAKETAGGSLEDKKPRKECRKSEVTESGGDSYPTRIDAIRQRNISTEASEDRSDLVKEKASIEKCQSKRSNKTTVADDRESFPRLQAAEAKFSSDEERSRRIQSDFLSDKWAGELKRPMTSQTKPSKRRPRSARTRKKPDDVLLDLNISKALHEKETQCILWSEERDKSDFLRNLNDSIRALQLLLDELKTKSTRERRNDVLKDMQSILMKISGMKSTNALRDTLSRRGADVRLMEGEENFSDQKKAFLALKRLCEELSEEKSALAEELNMKNCKITNLRNKEKEYLSLISNLKFNLESLKEEAEDGKLAKRDLLLLRAKLREEAKVIEVLKKSHGKMQALIEHYVLENDKLRAEAKMAKLESQKFHVLLAGKDVEIAKYKQEIELFQRQINQQLCLLRSKATEKEVEHAIEVISAQANFFQTEVDSLPSETTLEKREPSLELTETLSSVKTQADARNVDEGPSGDPMTIGNKKQEEEAESIKMSTSSRELKDNDANVKDGGFTSCKSDDSLTEGRVCDKFSVGLRGVLSSSKNLRSSVNEMLQDMRRGSSEKFWPSPSNSSTTSPCTVASSYSENVSECSQRD